MNPRLIRMTIVLMFLAMTGLVGIQIYWIREAVEQREQQFRQGVYEAMSNAIYEYEQLRMQSIMDKMDMLKVQEQIGAQLDSLQNQNRKKSRGNRPEEITININTPGVSRGSTWYSSRNGLDNDLVDPFGMDGQSIQQQFFSNLSNDTTDDYLSKLNGNFNIEGSNTLILNTFLELFAGYFAENESLDSASIDSLMSAQLKTKGINTVYEFGIFDPYASEFLISRARDTSSLKNSPLRISMALNPFQPDNHLVLFFPYQTQYLLQNMWFLLLASAFLIIIIIFSFAYTINIIFKQKKVSEIKNDLINNITHELKTPISTISLACQAMGDPDLAASPLRNNYLNMIAEENKRLALLVENVLQSAIFDNGEFRLKIKKVDIHQRIEKALTSLDIQVRNSGIRIVKNFKATEAVIEADEVMVTNLIFNLVDNAIKYYRAGSPYIKVSTNNDASGQLVIEIEDNGLGISKDDQKRIFEKLYRVPTGNVHNVKGYGLGLSYVKSIVERHHGHISVKSQPGEGSTFTIWIPLKQTVHSHKE